MSALYNDMDGQVWRGKFRAVIDYAQRFHVSLHDTSAWEMINYKFDTIKYSWKYIYV